MKMKEGFILRKVGTQYVAAATAIFATHTGMGVLLAAVNSKRLYLMLSLPE